MAGRQRFEFDHDRALLVPGLLAGVTPATAYIEIDDLDLRVRFGWWRLRTELANVASVTRTGPYRWFKVAGPPRLSMKDTGVTFATTASEGVCVLFHRPVACVFPFGLRPHVGMTVTPAEPEVFVAALEAARPHQG